MLAIFCGALGNLSLVHKIWLLFVYTQVLLATGAVDAYGFSYSCSCLFSSFFKLCLFHRVF